MFNAVALVHLRPGQPPAARDRVATVLRAVGDGGEPPTVAAVLTGSFNGGDVIWRARLRSDPAARGLDGVLADRENVAHVDGATFDDGRGGGHWTGSGVYRVLLLSVKDTADASRVERFERELLAMPGYIRSIRAWRLSRVREAAGARRWTHVWEQEYADVAGLAGPYMLHPYHWAVVDRWFDPESTDWIVDPCLCHSLCAGASALPPTDRAAPGRSRGSAAAAGS